MINKIKHSPTLMIILAFVAIYFIWGSTYMVNKIALVEIPPFALSAWRFLVAGLIIFIIALLKKIPIRITKKQFKNTWWVGFLFISVGNGFVINALQYVDSGITALIIATQPLILLCMMWILGGNAIKSKALIGVALGILGIYLLVQQDGIMHGEHAWYGVLMIFIALVSWAYGAIYAAKADLPKNHFINAGYQMFFGSIVLFIMSFLSEEQIPIILDLSVSSIYSFVYLVIFGSIIAFTSYNFLLKQVSPDKVATSNYVNPIVALFLGWWILNENVTYISILASFILLSGVYFINTNKSTPRN